MPGAAFIDAADLQISGAELTVLELIEKVKSQEEQLKSQEERILELETIVAALY